MAIRALSILVPAQTLKLVFSLVLQILIARLLLPEGRGIYAICISTSAVLLVATYLGNEFGIRYLLVSSRITTPQALRYLLLTVAFSLSISLVLIWTATFFDFWLTERVTRAQLALACILAFSQLVTTQINVFMTIKERYREAAVLGIVEEVIKLILMAVLLFTFPSVEVALLSVIIGNIIIALYSIVRFRFYVRDFEAIDIEKITFIYSYGLRSLWLNLSNLSSGHMGTLILSGLVSNERVGFFNLAYGLIARVQVLPDTLNRILVPTSAANNDHGARLRMVRISVTGLLVFSILVALVLGFLNGPIIYLLFGSEYIEAGPIAFILFVGFSFKVISKPLEAYFNEIVGNPRIIAITQVFSITMMALLTYVGAVQFGLVGAAIGSSAATFLGSIALSVAYARSTRQHYSALIDFRSLIERLGQLKR